MAGKGRYFSQTWVFVCWKIGLRPNVGNSYFKISDFDLRIGGIKIATRLTFFEFIIVDKLSDLFLQKENVSQREQVENGGEIIKLYRCLVSSVGRAPI